MRRNKCACKNTLTLTSCARGTGAKENYMNEQTQTILNYVVTFLSTGVGATVLTIVIKAIINAVMNVKTKKYSKLTDSDRAIIVENVRDGVLNAIKDGVSVDMDAQIDKATARRITAVERSQNEIVERINDLMECQRAVLSAVGDFKTISAESREQIKALLNCSNSTLEKVVEVALPKVEVQASEKAKTKLTY